MSAPKNTGPIEPPSTIDLDKLPGIGEDLWTQLADRLYEIDTALVRADRLLHAHQPWMKGKIGIGWRKLHEYEKRPYPVIWTYRRDKKDGGIRWFSKDIEPVRLLRRACSRGAFAEGYPVVREILSLVQELFDERKKLNEIIRYHRNQIKNTLKRNTHQDEINSRLASLEYRGTSLNCDSNIEKLMDAVENASL